MANSGTKRINNGPEIGADDRRGVGKGRFVEVGRFMRCALAAVSWSRLALGTGRPDGRKGGERAEETIRLKPFGHLFEQPHVSPAISLCKNCE